LKAISSHSPALEVVQYSVGKDGFQNVAEYDEVRYKGQANEYKQRIMASTYRKLLGSLQGKRVLDVGCGTGRGVVDFATDAAFAVGVDASPDMLSFAARKAIDQKLCGFSVSYAQQLPFKSGSFDVVTSLNFLHLFTLDTQRQMIAEMQRVLRPGGVMVLEFDNAVNGLGIGLLKRWSGVERGSLPGEIRYVLGKSCKIERVTGAVIPGIWRVCCKFPRLFVPVERITRLPLLNRLAHRLYYKLRKPAEATSPLAELETRKASGF
jgi:ubiquinone/menaquinone biosynthesis C-methylase UbiE